MPPGDWRRLYRYSYSYVTGFRGPIPNPANQG